MRLKSFRIKNFKSVIDTEECVLSQNDNITILAGQNEAGKSAVLEALEFFKNGPSPEFEKLQKRLGTKFTEVRCEYLLEQKDIEEISKATNDSKLASFLQKVKEIKFLRTSAESVTQEIQPDDNFTTELKNFLEKNATKLESAPAPETQSVTPEQIVQLLIALIPTMTLYKQFADLLPSEVELTQISANPAVKDFEKVFNINLTDIANIADPRERKATLESLQDKATDDFNSSWSQKLDVGDNKYRFIVDVNLQEPKKITFMVEHTRGQPLYLEQKSMGFRWFSAFHLRLRALKSETEQLTKLIILVDEPGQNLHETAQLDAKKVLEELASKGTQIIYSTHNARLIGTEGKEFARIRLVSNSKELGTKVETVSQFAARPNHGSADSLSPVITAMGLNSIATFVDRNKLNVVVEGITDNYYLTAFRKLLGKDDRLYFVPACGVNNVPNVVSVLLGWGFDYKAVFDDDPNSGRKAYNILKREFYGNDDQEAHNHILKIKDCIGIEDIFSKKDFQSFVLEQSIPPSSKNKMNSELAKGRKEILARQFLDKLEAGVTLSQETTNNANEIFKWLYQKFGIT